MLRWKKAKSEEFVDDLDTTPTPKQEAKQPPPKETNGGGNGEKQAVDQKVTQPPSVSMKAPIPAEPEVAKPKKYSTTIGALVLLEGNLKVDGNTLVVGKLTGDVKVTGRLEVGKGGIVSAQISVDNLTVAGNVNGDAVVREDSELLPGGKLAGTLRTSSLKVHQGAILEGYCSMGDNHSQN